MRRAAFAMVVLLGSAIPLLAQEIESTKEKKELEKLKADQKDLHRQLEFQLGQIQELVGKVEEYRGQLRKAMNEKSVAVTEMEYARKEAERIALALAALEKRHAGGIAAKVTAVAEEVGMAVISAGKDDGVLEKDEFHVLRGGEVVATIVIDRTDRKWSAGKIVNKKSIPRVADDVLRRASPLARPPSPLSEKSADALKDLRRDLDEVRRQVRALSDQLLPAWSRGGVALEEASEDLRAHLGIVRGLVIRRIREGSPAEKAGLRALDVVPESTETELLEGLEKGKGLRIVRRGKPETLGGK